MGKGRNVRACIHLGMYGASSGVHFCLESWPQSDEWSLNELQHVADGEKESCAAIFVTGKKSHARVSVSGASRGEMGEPGQRNPAITYSGGAARRLSPRTDFARKQFQERKEKNESSRGGGFPANIAVQEGSGARSGGLTILSRLAPPSPLPAAVTFFA